MSSPALRIWTPDVDDDLDTAADQLLSFGQDYVDGERLRPASVAEHVTTIRKLRAFIAHRSIRPMRDATIAGLVARFLDAVYSHSVDQRDGNPERVANKAREHVRAWLRRAAERDDLAVVPRLPRRRHQRDAADLVAFTRSEVDALYRAAADLRDPRFWSAPFPHADYWRAALVAFWTYGLDTQAVFARTCQASPLCWSDVVTATTRPDRSGAESAHGWLRIKRQKTQRVALRPLTLEARRHLELVTPRDPVGPIFRTTREPGDVFRDLVQAAGIPERVDLATGQRVAWTLKHFRKTAADNYESLSPGAGSAVLGHAADDRVARVTARHYTARDGLACRAILELDPPESFRVWNDRPPAGFPFWNERQTQHD